MAEKAVWDEDLLELELGELVDLDFSMDDFGLEFDFEEPHDDEELEVEKENARANTGKQYNLQYVDELDVEGFYQMPTIEAVDHVPTDLMGFNYMLNTPNHEAGIHFYLDDYQFERIWQRPEFYIEKLMPFDCVLSPDFSLYMDMPIAMKVWNVYRSRLIGQMCQRAGLVVIPTVSWAEADTFEFCFDGLPLHGTLSVSTIGVKREEAAFEIWRNGMDAMIERLEPIRLIVYGGKLEYDYGDVEVIYFENAVTERMKRGK